MVNYYLIFSFYLCFSFGFYYIKYNFYLKYYLLIFNYLRILNFDFEYLVNKEKFHDLNDYKVDSFFAELGAINLLNY